MGGGVVRLICLSHFFFVYYFSSSYLMLTRFSLIYTDDLSFFTVKYTVVAQDI